MEVHHHAHTARKKWTHYFWEFLMLFLAVFCGFLAENQREHYVERHREKEFLESLINDLLADTVQLNRTIILAENQVKITDSLMALINNEDRGEDVIKSLYRYHFSNRLAKPYFEDRTSSQLKNAGGMRLVQNKLVADLIIKYWSLIKICENISNNHEEDVSKMLDLGIQVFDSRYIIRSESPLAPPLGVRPAAILINHKPEVLLAYNNRQFHKRNRLQLLITRMNYTLSAANKLIETIKKKYDLK